MIEVDKVVHVGVEQTLELLGIETVYSNIMEGDVSIDTESLVDKDGNELVVVKSYFNTSSLIPPIVYKVHMENFKTILKQNL